MEDHYTDNISEDMTDEDMFFEHVIQEDFDLLCVDMLLRQSISQVKES